MIRLPDPERSRAFLFGAASYQADNLPDLPAVGNNLEGLRAALTSGPGAFTPEHCAVLLDPPEPVPPFNALKSHADQATDTLLIYFAGHGIPKLGGGLHFALTNTQSTNAQASGFDYDWLRDILNESNATNKIVIVDCCYSGRIVQRMSDGVAAQELEIEGTCVLTSTGWRDPALAPAGETYTTFTGQLLHQIGRAHV
jgi:hypothetical protein